MAVDPHYSVADFLENIERLQVPACDTISSTGRCFVPISKLRNCLTSSRIKGLLKDFDLPPNKWEVIRTRYLLVFATLCSFLEGASITHFIQYDYFADDQLPFTQPGNWPHSCKHLFDKFVKAQWKFCPRRFDQHGLHDTRIGFDRILPFTSRTPLKRGPCSSTYRVDIHPDYDSLHQVDDRAGNHTHTYVIKTCHEDDYTNHFNEVRVYELLRGKQGISNNLAKFYGSWRHDGKCHMLLEYVGGGTLNTYFQTTRPPETLEDLMIFWKNFLDLVKPVARLHELPRRDKDEQFLQMIHHDIKLDNILVSEPLDSNPYNVSFKLVDFGLTTLEKKPKRGKEVKSRDSQGTQMYSAPEYLRDDKFVENSVFSAFPSKDIWSLGCVYSEAIVWSDSGWIGLYQYRCRRREATNRIVEFNNSPYSGCFHNGKGDVLDEVRNTHLDIGHGKPQIDHITSDMIELVNQMLEPKHEERLNAMDVERRSRQAWKAANKLLTDTYQHPHPFDTPPRREPPQLPPEIIAKRASEVNISQPLPPVSTSDEDVITPLPEPSVVSGHLSSSGTHSRSVLVPQPSLFAEYYATNGLSPTNISDVIGWLSSNKYARRKLFTTSQHTTTLNGLENLPRLANRDQIFLIDNSSTMDQRQIWKEVRKVLEALSNIVSNSDKTSVYFTCSPREAHSKRPEVLLKIFDGVQPAGRSNPKVKIAQILGPYHPDSVNGLRRKRRSRLCQWLSRKKQKSGVSIYVLTDGVWEDEEDEFCGVHEPIRVLVDKYINDGLPVEVDVHFIRFGDDERGVERLERLSAGHHELGIPKGIVDTEPNTGNVWKMLFGPSSPAQDIDKECLAARSMHQRTASQPSHYRDGTPRPLPICKAPPCAMNPIHPKDRATLIHTEGRIRL
ncbi:kinase-like protein [Polyplosphaeria fusca]|uniref:Kinase-like protein n=1 Tax=Polyplosphaeria fusca TaxID=682080 RepID=A0A9P4R1B7_9PLEO|nr:kinase-like protein [Polyplosphaeria fusca]